MKIGIYSGSFNPVHIGHVILGSYIVDFTDIDEVWYVVSPQNPLKSSSELLDEHERLAMVDIALSPYPNLVASDFEFHLKRPSYTIDSLYALRTRYPEHEFYLIIGADNWCDFAKWKNYETLLSEFPILIFPRMGFQLNETVNCHLPNQGIEVLNSPIIEISSSFIRYVLNSNKCSKPYLPTEVYTYIMQHGLYKS